MTRAAIRCLLLALVVPAAAVAAPGAPAAHHCGDGVRPDAVDMFAYFRSEDAAIDAARRLDDAVFAVEVRAAAAVPGQSKAAPPEWVLRVVPRTMPSPAEFDVQARNVDAVAKAHGSHFTGKGCSRETPRGA